MYQMVNQLLSTNESNHVCYQIHFNHNYVSTLNYDNSKLTFFFAYKQQIGLPAKIKCNCY